MDVLDGSGALLAADVASGAQLSFIAAVAAQPSIRLRANLSTSVARTTPVLRDWTLGYFATSASTLDSGWSQQVSSTQDGTPPVITVNPGDYTSSDQPSVTLQGSASDTSGIQSLKVNGTAAVTGSAFAQWSTAAALPIGFSTFTITAQDHAVPPNLTTVLRRILRTTPTSVGFADGLADQWKIDRGLDPFDNSGANAANGDPDKDGIVNLLERALHLDPLVPDDTGLPSVTSEINGADGLPYLTFTYRRLLEPAGLSYRIETSPDLQSWAPAAVGDFDEISATPTGDGIAESVTVRLEPALTAPGMNTRFIRLRVRAE